MAFVVKDYGNGELGDVDSVSSTINSYARVTAVTTSTITINTTTQITGTATFKAGAKILLHVSATTSSSYKTYLGCYLLANVTAVNSGVLTLDADPTTCIPSANLAQYYVQAIAVAQYKNLTLNSGTTITPPVYSASNYHGGIVAIMCSETLKFGGGHISLTDKGIPVANKTLRPTTNNDPIYDSDNYAGYENSDTRIHFMLNAGDGATFIIAKTMVCNASSRIGNTATRGYQFYRGATNSVTYNETAPTNVTNVGGSTILIAAQTITNFTPHMFAKYRSSSSTAGQGVCRCFIASETKLRNDEGLYAYDCISDRGRMKRMLGIKNFGNGSFGDATDITSQLNNYAKITAVNGNKVTITNVTTDGLAQILQGAMVMVHWNNKNTTNVEHTGKFIIANVLDEFNGVLTLDTTPPNISVTDYAAQIVSIPQFNNFSLSSNKFNTATPKFDGSIGGICAIAVKGTFSLGEGAQLISHVANETTGYGRAGLGSIGNAQDSDKLPIGAGRGSTFVLANDLNITRYSNSNYIPRLGGRPVNESAYAYSMTPGYNVSGSGARGGTGKWNGGYGSNGTYSAEAKNNSGWWQGAHLMIVANTIRNLDVINITMGPGSWQGFSLGYNGGNYNASADVGVNYCGGYNGGGGSNFTGNNMSAYGYGGGSAGWVFIYCNNAVRQYTNSTVLAN